MGCASNLDASYLGDRLAMHPLKKFLIKNRCTNLQIDVYFIDTERERQIQLGQDYSLEKMEFQDVVMHAKLARSMGVSVGDPVYLQIQFQTFAASILRYLCKADAGTPAKQGAADSASSHSASNSTQAAYCLLPDLAGGIQTSLIPLRVKAVVGAAAGKLREDDMPSALLLEREYLGRYMSEFLSSEQFSQSLPEEDRLRYKAGVEALKQDLLRLEPEFFADQIIINIPDRALLYTDSDYHNIQTRVTGLAGTIARDLGVYPFLMKLPVLEALSVNKMSQMFFGIVLNIVILVLFSLSILLIYNILLVSVETKTYEIGMMRVLGL